MLKRGLLTIGLLLGAVPIGFAGDEFWPHWRGPLRNGVSQETDLPLRWSKTENIAWKLDLPGRSGSTPIVWGDRIFLVVTEAENIELWAVDRRAGRVHWKQHLGGGNKPAGKGNMSSPSPVTDGRHVWALTSTGLLRQFDFDGNQIWGRDIPADYGAWGLMFGYGSSPVLHGDSLYIQVLHGMLTDDPSYLLRLDKDTGETIWRLERPTDAIQESPDSYTTPIIVETASGLELVVTGGDAVTGHDPITGAELWRAEGLNPEKAGNYRIIASPVALGDLVFAPSRVRPLLALRAGGRGDVTRSHRVWSTDDGPDVPTPVTDGTYLYVLRDNGVMLCYDARTGALVYGPERATPGTYSASPVLADGRIYVISEDGVTTVIEAGPKFEILAVNDLGDYTLSSPVIADGQIFIRTDFALWAIGARRTG